MRSIHPRIFSLLILMMLLASPLVAEETGKDRQATDGDNSTLTQVDLIPMEATYRARLKRGVSVRGEAVRSLRQQDNGQWEYRFDVDSFIADIRESTTLSYADNRVKPHRYRYSLKGFMIRNRADRLDFEWEKQRIRDREEGKYYDISEHLDIQDQLGAQLQLWVDLKSGKEKMEYLIPHNNGVRDYQFAVIGNETLDTRFGKIETVVVERVRDADSPRTTLMWFAPEWNYLLVRLEQTNEGGEDFEIYLQKADMGDLRIRP